MTAHCFARCSFVFAAMLVVAATSAQASVEISSNPTHNMDCSDGVCTPTAKNADLNATDLANMLASSDVKVVTGNGAVTITVSSSFSWTSTHRLTLDAYYNVSFRAPVEVAGQGAVTIVTNDGGSGGDLIFFDGGKLHFWDTSSSLIINGNAFTLVTDVDTLTRDILSNPAGSYALASDYDAGSIRVHSFPRASLSGTVEGLGNSIQNLSVGNNPRSNLTGLIDQIFSGGVLRDLFVTNARVQGGIPGILAGFNYGTVLRCYTDGMVSGGNVGGLVGENFGIISESHSAATMSGTGGGGNNGGGLVGTNYGRIDHSYSTGDVSGTFGAAGGLVGGDFGSIFQSHATGNVTNLNQINDATGGLVGGAGEGETISQSFATGDVEGYTRAGGLIGQAQVIDQSYATGAVIAAYAGGLVGQTSFFSRVSNSYSTGPVTGNAPQGFSAGGFVGQQGGGTISFSYSTGAVSATGSSYLGGFVGEDDSGGQSKSATYWDLTTSGISDPSQGAGNIKNDLGIAGLTDAQLKSSLPTGFFPGIWGQKKGINNGYPYLLANPPQ